MINRGLLVLLVLLLTACSPDNVIVKERVVYKLPPTNLVTMPDNTSLKQAYINYNDNYTLLLYQAELEHHNRLMTNTIKRYLIWRRETALLIESTKQK